MSEMKSMIGKTFVRNKETTRTFTGKKDYDEIFLKSCSNYLNDWLRTYKYISLEMILRDIGMNEVDPDELDETEVYRFNGHALYFDYHWEGESMIVTICEDAGI